MVMFNNIKDIAIGELFQVKLPFAISILQGGSSGASRVPATIGTILLSFALIILYLFAGLYIL